MTTSDEDTTKPAADRVPIGTRATVTLSARRFYALISAACLSLLLSGILGTLLAIGYLSLTHRLEAVCDPLRYGGQQVSRIATQPAGRASGQTFDDAATKLGCPK